MNRSEFISFIEDPEKLSKDHLGAIRNIMTDFPYFSVAHVLYTKALHNERHYEFEKQLKQTALRVPDREVLYRFIHQVPAITVAEEVKTHVTEEQPVAIWTAEPEMSSIEVVEPETEVIEEQQEIPVFIESPVEETIVIEAEELEVVEEIADEVSFPVPVAETEKELVEEVPAILPEPVAEIITAEEVIVNEEPEIQEIPVTGPVAVIEEDKTDEPAAETNETHSFMEWLQLKATEPVVSSSHAEPVKEEIAETTTEEPEEILIHPEPVAIEEVTELPPVNEITQVVTDKAEDKNNVQQFENILDKFIREKPSISRPKAEFYNPVNMARQSVEEDEELVTETLASLYHKQGNHRKAIRAYEKLCLLYPGKMSYFAALIQKIKAEIKD